MILEETELLTEWYMPAIGARPADPAPRQDFGDIWRRLMAVIEPSFGAAPATLVLRDFHVDNLMWLPDRPGIRACGLLDFQDAVAGHRAYDLMSLLEDARRDVGAELAAAMIARYQAARPEARSPAFAAAYAVLAAQRHCKVIGIFTRLAKRDGKDAYLVHIGRVWRLLEGALRHPVLAELKTWLERNIPPARRAIPDFGGRP